MTMRDTVRLMIIAALCCCVSGIPVSAASIVVGSAISGSGARLQEQELRSGGTVLSGDHLQVLEQGTAVIGMDDGSRMTFGHNAIASFRRESSSLTAVLDRGTVDFFHPADAKSGVRLEIADVHVVPGTGFETMGEIAMTGDTLVVMTTEGLLRVEGGGRSVEIPQGKMITLHSQPARAPQISATTARPVFIHDLEIAAVTVIAAVALALLINHLINNSASTTCQILTGFGPPSSVLPPSCVP